MRDRKRPGVLVVSLDFELHWGVRDRWSVAEHRARLLGAREAVPAMLELFEAFGIHATWAIVGFLFCDGKRELLDVLPARLPAYAEPALSPYAALAAIGASERDDPFHFAPSLIARIAATPDQEIGTHTLSHYYCLEPGQAPADFRADVQAAMEVTRRKVGRAPQSIVFPRNQYSPPYLDVCGELGLVAYRGNPDAWAYRARGATEESQVRRAVRLADAYLPITGTSSHAQPSAAPGPVNVPASRYLRPYAPALRHLEPLLLHRIEADLRTAARRGRLFHLWWHPRDFGLHMRENLAVLRHVLTTFARLRDTHGMQSGSMVEAARRVAERAAPRRSLEQARAASSTA